MNIYKNYITNEEKIDIISSRIENNIQTISILENFYERSSWDQKQIETLNAIPSRILEIRQRILSLIKTRLALKSEK